MMRGTITLENGMTANFTLTDEQIFLLEQETKEVLSTTHESRYTIASELAYGIIRHGFAAVKKRRERDGEK